MFSRYKNLGSIINLLLWGPLAEPSPLAHADPPRREAETEKTPWKGMSIPKGECQSPFPLTLLSLCYDPCKW